MEKLESVAANQLAGRHLVVVSNREPYIHEWMGGKVVCMRPAGGLTTALDPVMQACGGTWIAHGSGSADFQSSSPEGKVQVPPNDPKYTLKRIWLESHQEEGYYYGFSNSGLWPLCHQVYQRPVFRLSDWNHYKEVNQKFADAILAETMDKPSVVFIQDYHFALLPKFLKKGNPQLVVAQFWHIPWPNPEIFRVCPWGQELLQGLLGCDLLSFQIQYHCNNFMETVDRTLECRLDREHFSIFQRGHETRIRPHPISVDPEIHRSHLGSDWESSASELRTEMGLDKKMVILGIDRVDYTKGISERILAIENLLERRADLLGEVAFVQIGAPSRTQIPCYRYLNIEIKNLVDRVNQRFGSPDFQPILFINRHADAKEVHLWYKIANICLVTSLHDGMNLVAKEFICSREDGDGVLVLSRFAGASRELKEALVINPFDISQMSQAIEQAIDMPKPQRQHRMSALRNRVNEHNIFRWAGWILKDIFRIPSPQETDRKHSRIGMKTRKDNNHVRIEHGKSNWIGCPLLGRQVGGIETTGTFAYPDV